ncbi:bestrophin-like domain [Streptomyces sp. NPDC004096]|uniref:bestrophin-like domain n=1 Tax=unclassified Streptomyces TaxID=2593676 RepID=UPI0033AEE824
MGLWLLNNLNTACLALLIVGGVVVLSLAACLVTRRVFPELINGVTNDVSRTVLELFGAIYGIVLAFVIVTLWTELEQVQAVVTSEATDLAVMSRNAHSFPDDVQKKLDRAIGDYVHAIVEDAWPLMRDGKNSLSATSGKLEALYAVLQNYNPKSASEQAFYSKSVERLNDVTAQRRTRILAATQQLPPLLQVLTYGGALVVMLITLLYGVENLKVQLLFVGSIALLVGLSLTLVLVLEHPFAGEVSVSPSPFMEGQLGTYWNR